MKVAHQGSVKGHQNGTGMQWAHEQIHRLAGSGLLDGTLGRRIPPVAGDIPKR